MAVDYCEYNIILSFLEALLSLAKNGEDGRRLANEMVPGLLSALTQILRWLCRMLLSIHSSYFLIHCIWFWMDQFESNWGDLRSGVGTLHQSESSSTRVTQLCREKTQILQRGRGHDFFRSGAGSSSKGGKSDEEQSKGKGPQYGEEASKGKGPQYGEEASKGKGPQYGEAPKGKGPQYGEAPKGKGPQYGEAPKGKGPQYGEAPKGKGPQYGEAPKGKGPQYGEAPKGKGPQYGEAPKGNAYAKGPQYGEAPKGKGPQYGEAPKGYAKGEEAWKGYAKGPPPPPQYDENYIKGKAKASRLRMTGRRAKAMASMAKGMTTTIVATSMAMICMRAREIPQARAETIGNIWIIELE